MTPKVSFVSDTRVVEGLHVGGTKTQFDSDGAAHSMFIQVSVLPHKKISSSTLPTKHTSLPPESLITLKGSKVT